MRTVKARLYGTADAAAAAAALLLPIRAQAHIHTQRRAVENILRSDAGLPAAI